MSDAPRWPGADGSPGLDFSSDRSGSGSIYRDEPSSASSAAQVGVKSAGSPATRESAAESTTISPRAGNQSAVEWATRPLGTAVPAPRKPVARSATSAATAASSASAVAAPLPEPSADSVVSAPRAPRVGSRRTRKARLRLARIDPWSVMKTTFLFSIAFGVMLIIVVSVLWSIIAGSGALDAVNQFMTTLVGDQGGGEFRVEDFISGSRILGFAAVLAAIDVVIITAVSTLFAFLYNLAATIMGGLEVTLAED
ncbi:MAG: DUF3566 domain-containing protein [Arachnia sp.]